jgi:hypothetical protein
MSVKAQIYVKERLPRYTEQPFIIPAIRTSSSRYGADDPDDH